MFKANLLRKLAFFLFSMLLFIYQFKLLFVKDTW